MSDQPKPTESEPMESGPVESDPVESVAEPRPFEEAQKVEEQKATDSLFTVLSCAAVVVTLILGFSLLGSPGKQRKIALDRERVQALRDMQIDLRYWANDGLPETLPEQMANRDNFRDPVTNELFEYRRLGDRTYELCATFDTDSNDDLLLRRWDTREWVHPKGRHCFELEADDSNNVPRPPIYTPFVN